MKLQYKLTEVKPRIFFLNFKSQYQCAMTFLRYQEYYESPSLKFRSKTFNILDFMDWYVQDNKTKICTYSIDWVGFNIPANIITDIRKKGIPDENQYDAEMLKVYQKCLSKYPDGKFYLIGAVGTGITMKHEIAHGFFYTIPEYKREMIQLVDELSPMIKKRIFKWLVSIGYTDKVLVDECQAYLSTGFNMSKLKLTGQEEPFKKVYNKYYKQV